MKTELFHQAIMFTRYSLAIVKENNIFSFELHEQVDDQRVLREVREIGDGVGLIAGFDGEPVSPSSPCFMAFLQGAVGLDKILFFRSYFGDLIANMVENNIPYTNPENIGEEYSKG